LLTRKTPEKTQARANPRDTDHIGRDFAWETHRAMTAWTSSVDTKATIVLSISGLLLGLYLSELSAAHTPIRPHHWQYIVGFAGMALTAAAVIMSGLVVTPRLNRRRTRQNWQENYIYFGHLRLWDPSKLRQHLASLSVDQELFLLADQLVSTAKIAWRKHSLLQIAMGMLLCGVLLVALALAWR
jgi:hypothetical protein